MRSDRDIHSDIEAQIRLAPAADGIRLAVEVSDGVVTLAGSVPSYSDKAWAEDAVKGVPGVTGIANDIRVEVCAAQAHADSRIAHEAVEAIRADLPRVAEHVQVVVRERHVTLEGAVELRWQRERIESNVRGIKGVDVVSNLIAIRPRGEANGVECCCAKAGVQRGSAKPGT